ncbi:MAG TPA: hypothetical protein VGB19_10625 [Actinomycetota bacterium]
MARDFDTMVRPGLEGLLEPGETLRGLAAATFQKTFSGGLYAIGVTDRRLILQPLDRKLQPKKPARSVGRADVAKAELGGAGGGDFNAASAVMDAAALTLVLRTTDGQKFKLSMMRGSDGVLGGLSGGAAQLQGVTALTDWLRGEPAG